MSSAPVPSPRRGRRLLCLVAAGTLLLALYMARGWLLPEAARALDVSEPPPRVDAVMVLGGGATTRPFVAAALVRAGLARRVLVPGVRLSPGQEEGLAPPESEVIRRVLRARGVLDGDVVTLPGEAASTRDEARALACFLDGDPGATVAVVTNGFHTRRARLLFRRELGERLSRVHFVAAPTDGFNTDDWWRHEEGLGCYLTEYVKLVYYGLREDRAWQASALGAAAVLAGLAWRRWRRKRS
jgi:uncharacterized SAM-binding protein YcdF (DUF218 family)